MTSFKIGTLALPWSSRIWKKIKCITFYPHINVKTINCKTQDLNKLIFRDSIAENMLCWCAVILLCYVMLRFNKKLLMNLLFVCKTIPKIWRVVNCEIFRPIFWLYQKYVLQYCDPLAEVDWTLLAFLKNIIQNVPIPQDATTSLHCIYLFIR